MGIVSTLMRPQIGAYAPHDDYWYNPVSTQSSAGVRVDADSAMCISAVWACVRVISESIASVPLVLYERTEDDKRTRATNYYLYDVLHNQPNNWQTSLEWREMMTASALLRGNGYSEIMPGRRGFADQLIPLHPASVTPEQYRQGQWRSTGAMGSGPIRYKVRREDGTEDTLNDDRMFHLRGLSNGGLKGMSVVEYARESFGLALATESYGARLFSQDARPGGVLEHPGALSDPALKHLKESWEQAHTGLANAHRVAILEEGMKWHQLGMTNEDSQFLETRSFQIADAARWFRVPLHMIQETTKETSWGSGIESLSLAFVIYTLLPWAKRWESAISRDLITETKRYYAEHLFDALLRGDLKSRYDAYAVARNWSWLSPNDIRRMENMDPIADGDIYLQPLNMVEAGTPPPQPEPTPTAPPRSGRNNAHYLLLLREAAARVIRKEIAALSKAGKRCGTDPAVWQQAIDEFYADHAGYVAQCLGISPEQAARYVAQRRPLLAAYGAAALQDSEDEWTDALVQIALEDN